MKKVLVVEDSVTTRMFYRSTLEDAGFEVAEASNGLEGLEMAMMSHFDLVVVDINMPKMDGYEMIRELRRNPDLVSLPVITISTESGRSDERMAFKCGANYYIVKPADPTDLALTANMLTGVRV
ncbi:response regulator [Asticcacaulis benevestitus]|nr:response regulator [Asticcacaulis benevestitus]